MAEETLGGAIQKQGGDVGAKTAVHHVLADSVGGVAAGIKGTFQAGAVSVAAGLSVILSQLSYKRRRAELTDMYRDEAAAKLGKTPDKIRNKDIEMLAEGDPAKGISGNKTLSQEIKKLKTRRWVGMVTSAVSIVATVALLNVAFPAAGAMAGLSIIESAAIFAAKVVAGIAVHSILERPITNAGRRILGIDGRTTHDRIADLNREHKHGKALGREEVAGVFISANKELSGFVKERYGKSYDMLAVRDKQAIAEAFEQYLPIGKITESLNSGRVKVSELAFSVEGQVSGVISGSVPKAEGIVEKAKHMLHDIGEKIHHVHRDVEPQRGVATVRTVVEYDNPTPKRSFVERYEAEKAAAKSRTLH